MLLSKFNGGLNTNITPNLISINEAQECVNVDTTSVALKPLKGHTATTQNFGSNQAFTYFKGSWISHPLGTSYVKFNDVLYYTTGTTGVMKTSDGITFKQVGLTAPTSKLITANNDSVTLTLANSVETANTTDLVADTYSYRLLYYVDGEYQYIDKDFTYTGQYGITPTIVVPSEVTKFMLYRLYDSTYKLIDNVLDDTILDISLNSSYSIIDSSNPADVRSYCYTFYNSNDGMESGPSPISDDLTIITNSINISNIGTTTEDATSVRLYRIGGDLTEYTLVDELSLGFTTYSDTKTDIDIAGHHILDTVNNIVPSQNIRHLTEYASTLFGSVDNVLWYSDSGLVTHWGAYNFITFAEEIIGLGATQNGLLVFTKNQTYILIGTSSNNFQKVLLHNSQGCTSHTTIQYVNNVLIWQSLDGICISNGSDVKLISKTKLGKFSLNPIASVIYDEEYYLFHDVGCLIVEKLQIFKNLDLIVQGAYYSYDFDTLYFINPNDNGMYSFSTDTNTNLTYKYKTGWLSSHGITNIEMYKNLYIYSSGPCELKVYIDSKLITTQNLIAGINDIKLPSTTLRGYYAELEFTGSSIIYEVEFKTEGRQNGR